VRLHWQLWPHQQHSNLNLPTTLRPHQQHWMLIRRRTSDSCRSRATWSLSAWMTLRALPWPAPGCLRILEVIWQPSFALAQSEQTLAGIVVLQLATQEGHTFVCTSQLETHWARLALPICTCSQVHLLRWSLSQGVFEPEQLLLPDVCAGLPGPTLTGWCLLALGRS
jgi:hypothetical protein